jgi:mannosyl-3-phosphoglycerate phosphatase
MQKLIVFTDLDGSLLDHATYEWQPAKPAIDELERRNFPLVFASSKTFAEISKLRKATGNHHPAIIENGGAVVIPAGYFENEKNTTEKPEIHNFAKPYEEITGIAHALRAQHGYLFRGFSDIDVDELCKLTSLDEDSANAAKAREATEPILWNEGETRLEEFRTQLEKHGLTLTRGGRFFHIMSPVSKGQAVTWLLQRFREAEPESQWVSVALGDNENDIQMLELVDYPVLVKNPYTDQPKLKEMSNLIRTRLVGPEGWNDAVLSIIHGLEQGE